MIIDENVLYRFVKARHCLLLRVLDALKCSQNFQSLLKQHKTNNVRSLGEKRYHKSSQ